jgi:molybdate transport system permease protein
MHRTKRFNTRHLVFFLYFLAILLLGWLIFTFIYQYIAALGSFKEVVASWKDYRILTALWISVSSSFVTLFLGIIFAIPLGYIFAVKNFYGKALMETLAVEVPQTFPPVAEGIIYYLMLGPHSIFHLNLAYTFTALVIAKTYVSAPFVVSIATRRFREIHQTGMSITARTLGANPFQVFRMIFLPLSYKDLAAGLSLCWSRAMGELGGSLIFAGVIPYHTETIPTFIGLQAQTLTFSALGATILATTASTVAIIAFKIFTKE